MNLGCTREGLVFVVIWQALFWSVFGLSTVLSVPTDLRDGAVIILFVIGVSVIAVKTEWRWFGGMRDFISRR